MGKQDHKNQKNVLVELKTLKYLEKKLTLNYSPGLHIQNETIEKTY